MRITHEADYAIRIMYHLTKAKRVVSAKELSEKSGVTLRFTLKILRKLSAAGVVKSYKGVNGGYELCIASQKLSFGNVIEIIDGPIKINHCLGDGFGCTRVDNKECCPIRQIFQKVNDTLKEDLYKILIEDVE